MQKSFLKTPKMPTNIERNVIKFKSLSKVIQKLKMKKANLFFVLTLSLVSVASSLNEDDCTWNYKCCEFKELEGAVTCTKMCEAEILCEQSKDNDVETLDEFGGTQSAAYFLKSSRCRQGFRFSGGKCRKVLK